MQAYNLSHLSELESEAIYVLREVAAQFENPVLLFSGGKDSITCAHLARKAFWPAKIPFTFMHVDTGHNFPETIEFRDYYLNKLGVNLIVASVQECIDQGLVTEEKGFNASRNALQTVALLKGVEDNKFDAAIGGARRDEEKARAKERFFSHRDDFGQWDPKNQRPELWNIFNGKKNLGESFRIFPISNWTEMDIWQYILKENIELPSLYFSHERECFIRDGVVMSIGEHVPQRPEETTEKMTIRFRTIGDMTCTGAVYSDADSLEKIIEEVASTRVTERGTRSDDKRSEAAMEDRKKQGYF
ncbi:sulfate adenylyltransferase subunit CysD [Acidiluteibacter ferrifornacis]|jgi:sulfate adenylyltransferase subunit 2|uniref:Sulfate adenylyltransferase subunit 2 n=1 Tax=Acidiluteibacter ferrifornacis TaxID=2692424 RepID=A0A6N9NDV4_9FLAO|nr:sulfate adenylyltransferase subunit CysD [Acidiluteibacter ferrifornacis]MBR9830760.1 sulfate adenylyltransferase subunit CysD [bacterium]NBG64788.1 sulfate adenylyltransferase subunit CysD [Acidiluteibacter ferrifornacis]